ncbi:MAG: hypothetical protein JW818_20070, partial [Pirellulales bacterium]|nr:hypothetical protein [Pirellulales bacterium]
LADVGRHCVIGAGAVVTEPIPDYAVAVGVPARVIRYRKASTEQMSRAEASSYPGGHEGTSNAARSVLNDE